VPVSARDFCERVRSNPLASSPAGLERLQIGIKRLLSVLDREEVAGIRTLEMKISDGGPTHMRVEPHILGLAAIELETRGRVLVHNYDLTATHPWYSPSRLPRDQIDEKLNQLVAVYGDTIDPAFTAVLGDSLEISIFKILRLLKAADRHFTFFGSFDLSQRRQSGRNRKTEPPSSVNDRSIGGPADFVIFEPTSRETALIECKNLREWQYPSSDRIKSLVRKAIAADVTPILIARRIPFITKQVLCEPAGIIAHETYNQLYPDTEHGRQLAARVREIRGLGYFDVRASDEPLPRTIDFFQRNLPALLSTAAEKFRANRNLLSAWVADDPISWPDLRRALHGNYEGSDFEI
jgi:hypothetical protein